MNEKHRARRAIEISFRETVDRDIELLAERCCRERGLSHAAGRCARSHGPVSDLIWARFGACDWSNVEYVYDGVYSHASRYLWAKVDLTVAWASRAPAPELEVALVLAAQRLRELWTEWAGYQATLTDDLSLALERDWEREAI